MQIARKAIGLMFAVGILISTSVFANGQGDSDKNADPVGEMPITVFTSILPQQYFVEKIGGDRVDVQVLVGPGKSPATYEPTPQQVALLGSAECLFAIGVPFEKAFLSTIESTLSSLKIVDTADGIQRRRLDGKESAEDTPGHGEGAQDPHIWLSLRLVKVQAQNIYAALVDIDPAGRTAYKEGYDSLIRELDDVDAELASVLNPFEGSVFFVFHPAFGYFGDDYGLTQVAIETGGKEPAPAVLEEIIEQAKDNDVRIIFVQPEFSQNSAEAIAEAIDGAVISLHPLNPDYINNLKNIADEISTSLQ